MGLIPADNFRTFAARATVGARKAIVPRLTILDPATSSTDLQMGGRRYDRSLIVREKLK